MFDRWRLVLIAGVTALAVAISTFVHGASAQAVSAPRFSAVELADAIAFGQGPAAAYLPVREDAPALDAKALRVKALVDDALTRDTATAATLQAQLQSGDRVAVSRAVVALGKLAQRALNEVYGAAVTKKAMTETKARLTGSAANNSLTGTGLGAASVNVNVSINYNYAYAYAALYGAVAVLILLVLILPADVANLQGLTGGGHTAQLAHEQFIDQIATGLQVA